MLSNAFRKSGGRGRSSTHLAYGEDWRAKLSLYGYDNWRAVHGAGMKIAY